MLKRLLAKLARSSVPSKRAAGASNLTDKVLETAKATSRRLGPMQLLRAGRTADAAAAADAALAVEAADAEALAVRGLLFLDGGGSQRAVRHLQQAAAANPKSPVLQTALGRALARAGRANAARQAFLNAVKLDVNDGEPLLQLALLDAAAGREPEAFKLLTDAVRMSPDLADAHYHLADLLRGRGRLQEAEEHYRLSVNIFPENAQALCNLGSLLKDLRRGSEAERYLEDAVRIKPSLSPATFNLAMIRIDQRRWSDAAELLKLSLASDGKQSDAQYWLGNAWMALGDVEQARKAYQAAIRIDANYIQPRWGYAMAQIPAIPANEAEQRGAPESFRKELDKLKNYLRGRKPGDGQTAVGAQQPYYLAYIFQNHATTLAEYGGLCAAMMKGWATKVGVPAPAKTGGAKCRVGIVSAHVHSHSVWHAILRGWIEHLDSSRFELHLFYTGAPRDTETEWATRRVSKLHYGLGDWTAWAKAISDSRPDVLIFPEIGMDSTAVRLAGLRLARVQLASWGHPITTGLPTIDGFISAQALEPHGAETHYTESLIALPRLGCCYSSYATTPAAVDLATFRIAATDRLLLCAGTPFKYRPEHDAVWVEIARRCRPCKLIFFRSSPESLAARLEARLRGVFDAAQLPFDECVRFVPWQSQAAFFGLLDRADVYLDSVGFSGFNTCMQAIERGTPVVAYEGEFMRGRFASGILRQAKLDEWVARTQDEYIELVARLCASPELRNGVRAQIAARRAALFGDRACVTALGDRLLELASAQG